MRVVITEDMEQRAKLGQLTKEERQQIRDEMLWYRKHLMSPRKTLYDLLDDNNKGHNK